MPNLIKVINNTAATLLGATAMPRIAIYMSNSASEDQGGVFKSFSRKEKEGGEGLQVR